MENKIFVLGDLFVDYIFSKNKKGNNSLLNTRVGGTAFNGAKYLKKVGLKPVIIGKVGSDKEGQLILNEIKSQGIDSLVNKSNQLPTGICKIGYSDLVQRKRNFLKINEPNANYYDLSFIEYFIENIKFHKNDIIFVATHFFARNKIKTSQKFIETLHASGAKIVLDVVPHNIYDLLQINNFSFVLSDKVNTIIAEFQTLKKLIHIHDTSNEPNERDWQILFDNFPVSILVVRYGIANIEKQEIHLKDRNGSIIIEPKRDTGFTKITNVQDQSGFGDILTAEFFLKYKSYILKD